MLVEQVSVQGKADSNKSVSEYYIKTSTDNINFNFVLEGSRRKVNQCIAVYTLFQNGRHFSVLLFVFIITPCCPNNG